MVRTALHFLAWTAVCAWTCAAFAATPEGGGERKVALVIGNARYASSPLANPVHDAQDVAARLSALGFDVILKTDAGLKDMTRAITLFGQRLSQGSVALFYFAGHGIQARGRNFLVPVDAEIGQESSVMSEAVDVDQVLEQLSPARVSVVILDACRNNPFERRFRGGAGGGLAQMDAPKGTMIAYATAPGKVALDGDGRNGLYTTALLQALKQPERKIEDVFKQVRSTVSRETGDRQVPWESSSLTGDLYLGGSGKPAALSPVAVERKEAPSDLAAYELEFWRSVQASNTAADYRAYLAKYPKGQFVMLAQTRLAETEKTARAAPPAEPRNELRCEEALPLLRQAIETRPDQPKTARILRKIVECETSAGHPFKARQAAKTLLSRYPDSPEAAWVRQQAQKQGLFREEKRPAREPALPPKP